MGTFVRASWSPRPTRRTSGRRSRCSRGCRGRSGGRFRFILRLDQVQMIRCRRLGKNLHLMVRSATLKMTMSVTEPNILIIIRYLKSWVHNGSLIGRLTLPTHIRLPFPASPGTPAPFPGCVLLLLGLRRAEDILIINAIVPFHIGILGQDVRVPVQKRLGQDNILGEFGEPSPGGALLALGPALGHALLDELLLAVAIVGEHLGLVVHILAEKNDNIEIMRLIK